VRDVSFSPTPSVPRRPHVPLPSPRIPFTSGRSRAIEQGYMSKRMLCLFMGAALMPVSATHATHGTLSETTDPATEARTASAAERLEALPMIFEPNVGQADDRVKFIARGRGYTAFVTETGVVLGLNGKRGGPSLGAGLDVESEGPAAPPRSVTLRWPGADLASRSGHAEGENRLEGKINYLVGDDPANWKTDVPTFERVRYEGVYPGVDLVLYGNGRSLEYDFVVAPGADPRAVAMEFEGADSVKLDESGDLVIRVGDEELRQPRPTLYQVDGEGSTQLVQAGYSLDAAGKARIDVGSYDAARALVVDPAIFYSTYLGGAGSDTAYGIFVDALGSAYVTGSTSGPFPTTFGAFDTTFNGATDAFVTKLTPAGNALVYSTYLGGTLRDMAYDVAVDPAGNAYAVGGTSSANYPTTAGSFDPFFNGGLDVFVTKLNAAGNALVYSTFVGSAGSDRADALALDTAGFAYVTGVTWSPGYPVTAGAFDVGFNGASDAFVTKLSPPGNALVYSTFLGGAGDDNGDGIALDTLNQAHVTGSTRGAGFPVTAGAFDVGYNGGPRDVFATKLNVAGAALLYSTFLGGALEDYGADIAVAWSGGIAGQAYVTGYSRSVNYPTTAGSFDTTANGGYDAVVSVLNLTGAALVYSTFVGGALHDYGRGIVVDPNGSAHFVGSTASPNFPMTPGTIDPTFNGVGDAFAARLSPPGNVLLFSTFLGGASDDSGNAVGLVQGRMFMCGYTGGGFPVTAATFDTTFNGGRDAFVTRLIP
jgi:hypothetical protein